MTRRPIFSKLILLLATVQLLLPTVAALADGAIEREASARSRPQVHIEAQTFNGCERIHPADCALCHAACAMFTRSAPQPLVFAPRRLVAAAPDTARTAAASPDSAWDTQPRAPPALG